MSFFVQNNSLPCFFVPNPPIDNWNPMFARNTIATFIYALDERSPDGNTTFNRFLFNQLNWDKTNLIADPADNSSLAVIQWSAQLNNNANVTVAFIQTGKVGRVNYNNATVLPKTWQTIVHIQDFQFQNPNNTLTLEVMAATGFGVNRTEAGVLFLPHPNSTLHDEAYCKMATNATVNSTEQSVSPTTFNLVSNFNLTLMSVSPVVSEQLTVQYGTFGVWRSNVTFPQGASDVWYQVRTGIGDAVTTDDFEEAAEPATPIASPFAQAPVPVSPTPSSPPTAPSSPASPIHAPTHAAVSDAADPRPLTAMFVFLASAAFVLL
jgi:hypothetical protein